MLDQGHRESIGRARSQYTFLSSPVSDSGVLHLEIQVYRRAPRPQSYSAEGQTFFGNLRYLGPTSKRKACLLARSRRILLSVLTGVPPGGGSMELGPLPSSPRWNSLPEGRKHQSLRDPSPGPSNTGLCVTVEWNLGR